MRNEYDHVCVIGHTGLTPEIRHVTTLQSSGTQYHMCSSTLSVQHGNKGLCQQGGREELDNRRVASWVEKSHDGIRKKKEHQLVVTQPTKYGG